MNARIDNQENLVTLEIDGVEIKARKGAMLIEATDNAHIHVPRFCYHSKLSIAANCRMCLVDVEKAPKPLPACATPVAEGMKVWTQSERALKAQKGVMEFLLINHPLDCPICDQGGECELQDLAMGYGRGVSRFSERKRVVEDEDLGPLIATEMTRCIHCTRCVRFLDEVAGQRELGGMGRGEHMAISTHVGQGVASEMSGNIIDLCPVGALTSKPYRFTARSWEMLSHPTVSPHDPIGSNLQIHHLGGRIKRVVPRANETINECWIADRDRFSYEGLYSDDRLTAPMIKRDGQWHETDWETALDAAATGLRGVIEDQGPDHLGALVSPSATIEEMYLMGRLARGLGSANVDARLRTGDFSDQDVRPAFPGLGTPLADLPRLDLAVVVGGFPRNDQPILNHRLRQAALRGAEIHYLNPRAHAVNYPVAAQRVLHPDGMVADLALIAKALLDRAGAAMPDGMQRLIDGRKADDWHASLAQRLSEAENPGLLLGPLVEAHPRGGVIRCLASLIAEQAGGHLSVLTEGANVAGAWIAGAVPHRGVGGAADMRGLDARAMIEVPRKGYLLLGVEPELDCWDGAAALAALQAADTVVALTAYVTDAMREYADVLLPVAAFGETSGSFVSAEGVWQSFPGVARPVGEGRPAWKVLRVLGNVLNLEGFDYNEPTDVTEELRHQSGEPAVTWRQPWLVPEDGQTAAATEPVEAVRAGTAALYGTDSLVRRASALQRTPRAREQVQVHVTPAMAEGLGVASGDQVRLQQGPEAVVAPVLVDEGLAEGVVWVWGGTLSAIGLGPMVGPISLARV